VDLFLPAQVAAVSKTYRIIEAGVVYKSIGSSQGVTMSAAPKFSPSPVDFGIVAPFSQTVVQVACPPLSTAVSVTAGITPPSTAPVFGVQSVGPPPKAVVGRGGVQGPAGAASGGLQETACGSGISGQELIAAVEFAAPANGSGAGFAATLEISSPDWDNSVTVPLQAQVGNLTIVCPPVSVEQARGTQVTLTVAAEGPATTATLSILQAGVPPGITVGIAPSTFNFVAGESQTATLTVSAGIAAVPGVSDLTINWAAFGSLTSFTITQLTVTNLVLPESPIDAKYAAFPNAATVLGQPIGPRAFCDDFVGQYEAYENGVIYWSGQSGALAFEINGPVLTRYLHSTNPEIGAPPGFPSATPTLGDYANAPSAGFGYPIDDTFLSNSGCHESRFENDCGIYATGLGAFVVSPEAPYLANGGSTGPLGLPIADAIGGVSSLGWTFSYQDFENGAIFSAFPPAPQPADNPEAVVFSQILAGTGALFQLQAGNGQTIDGTLYLQPKPPGLIPIPQWGLAAFAPGQITTVVQSAIPDLIAKAGKDVKLQGNATLQGITDYSAFRNLAPIRQYTYGFTIDFSACVGLVSLTGDIAFDLYFSLSNIEVVSGPGQQVSVSPINPSVTLHATDIPTSTLVNSVNQIQNAVTGAAVPTIQVPATYAATIDNIAVTAQLMATSVKVLSDGTLCLFVAVTGATSS
jgi:hypothetical protein